MIRFNILFASPHLAPLLPPTHTQTDRSYPPFGPLEGKQQRESKGCSYSFNLTTTMSNFILYLFFLHACKQDKYCPKNLTFKYERR